MTKQAIIPEEARKDLLKLRLLYLLTGLAGGLFNPYLTTLFVHQGIGADTAGLLMSAGTLLSILVQPVWGILVDRFRQTKLVLLLSIAVPAFLSFFYQFDFVVLIIAAYILSIAFQATQSPIADSYAVTTARTAKTSYGTIRSLGSLGTAIGGYAGGYFLSHFAITQLWMPFLGLSLAGAVTVLTLTRRTGEMSRSISLTRGLRELLGDPRFVLFLVACFFVNQTLTAYNSFFVLSFQSAGGSYSLVGTALLLASLTNVPSMLLAARIVRGIGHERTLLLAAFFYALRWGIQWMFPVPAVMVGIQVLHGLSFGLFYVAAVEYVAKASGKEMQATGQSIFTMVFSGLGGIVGNSLNGYLFYNGGADAMYFACTVSALLGACLLFVISRMRQARV